MGQFLVIVVTLLYTTMGCQDENLTDGAWPGSYAMTQTCDGAANPRYTMKITAADSSLVHLENLGGYGQKVKAAVQGDSLTITPTDVNVGLMGKVGLSGTGFLQGSDLTIQLNVRVPGPQGSTTTSVCELHGAPIDG